MSNQQNLQLSNKWILKCPLTSNGHQTALSGLVVTKLRGLTVSFFPFLSYKNIQFLERLLKTCFKWSNLPCGFINKNTQTRVTSPGLPILRWSSVHYSAALTVLLFEQVIPTPTSKLQTYCYCSLYHLYKICSISSNPQLLPLQQPKN